MAFAVIWYEHLVDINLSLKESGYVNLPMKRTPCSHAARQPECGQRPDDRPRASPVQPGHNAVQSGAVRTLRKANRGWRGCDGGAAVLS
ncbi:hypothetical protein QTP88_016448 [Uroleucon formosanum]